MVICGVRDRGDVHDVIWLLILTVGLIMLWSASEHWRLPHLWRRLGHALHLGERSHHADPRR